MQESVSSTSTNTGIKHPTLRTFARGVWLIFAILIVIFYIANTSASFTRINTSCSNDDCTSGQVTDDGIKSLEEIGLSVQSYALLEMSLDILTIAIYMISAIVVFWRASDNWMAILVSVVLMGFPLGLTSSALADSIADANTALIVIGLQRNLVVLPFIILFFTFPNGQFVPSWSRWFIPLAIIIPIAIILIFSAAGSLIVIAPITIFATAFGAQIYRYRRVSNPEERQQTKWVVFGFAMFFAGALFLFMPFLIFPDYVPIDEPLSSLSQLIFRLPYQLFFINTSMAILPIGFALSTLRYRLWDVDPIINRSLVYGIFALLVIVIFFLTSFLIQVIFGNQQIIIALAFSLIVSAAIFNPVRNRVQHLVDRHIYGLRFDLNELNRAQQIRNITNPGNLTGLQLGDYEVRGLIGKGGMGEVYEGFGNGEQVAIKTMLPDIAKNPELRTRFEREVEAGKLLQHPNIARVIGSGEHQGTPYLIMEYVEGQDLGKILDTQGAFDTETATRIMQDVCAALTLAHKQGYVHRDIKPSNIMIRNNGAAVLMDFGISKVKDAHTITGTGMVGTIQYMAPEQIMASKNVDHRADIYALACVLYQMLVGETPFTGGAAQVMFAHIQQPAPDPQDKQSSIPDSLADAILKALEKKPEKRFDSAESFSHALI